MPTHPSSPLNFGRQSPFPDSETVASSSSAFSHATPTIVGGPSDHLSTVTMIPSAVIPISASNNANPIPIQIQTSTVPSDESALTQTLASPSSITSKNPGLSVHSGPIKRNSSKKVSMASSPAPSAASSSSAAARRYRVPDDLRRRAAVSCDRCKLRRARCVRTEGEDNCENCKRHNSTCVSTLPRKHRIYGSLESLSLRFRALEGLVCGLFPDENTQDVTTLFKLATERNISHLMPPPDQADFASAIFDPKPLVGGDVGNLVTHGGGVGASTNPPITPSQDPVSATGAAGVSASFLSSPTSLSSANIPTIPQSPPPTQSFHASPLSQQTPVATNSPLTIPAAVQPSAVEEQLVSTPQGFYHYIGPTSTFGFASNVRSIVSRCGQAPRCKLFRRDIAGALTQLSNFTASHKAAGQRVLGPSLQVRSMRGTTTIKVEPLDDGNDKKKRKRPEQPGPRLQTTGLMGEVAGSDAGSIRSVTPGAALFRDLLPLREDADELVNAYFEYVHPTTPIFLRSWFDEVYNTLWTDNSTKVEKEQLPPGDSPPYKWKDDPGWMCCIILALSFGADALAQHTKRSIPLDRQMVTKLVRNSLLSKLLLASCLINTQALYMLHIYEHNAGERNLSWMLLGAATRMSMAIGMHRNLSASAFKQMEYEVRRRVWWTLYLSENVMSIIIGRPSSISDCEVTVAMPDESFFGDDIAPPDYLEHTIRLVRILTSIGMEVYRLVSPNLSLPDPDTVRHYLALLDTWYNSLPPVLLPKWNSMRLCHRRAVLLLHLYYTFARCLLTRSFFLRKVDTIVTELERSDSDLSHNAIMGTLPASIRSDVNNLSKVCIRSAEQAASILLQMTNSGLFDCVSSFDGYYVYHAIFILALDIIPRPMGAPEGPDERAHKAVVKSVIRAVHRFNLATTFRLIMHVTAQLVAMIEATDDSCSPESLVKPSTPVINISGQPANRADPRSVNIMSGRQTQTSLPCSQSTDTQRLSVEGQSAAWGPSVPSPRSENNIQIVRQPAMLDVFPAAYVAAPWDYFHLYGAQPKTATTPVSATENVSSPAGAGATVPVPAVPITSEQTPSVREPDSAVSMDMSQAQLMERNRTSELQRQDWKPIEQQQQQLQHCYKQQQQPPQATHPYSNLQHTSFHHPSPRDSGPDAGYLLAPATIPIVFNPQHVHVQEEMGNESPISAGASGEMLPSEYGSYNSHSQNHEGVLHHPDEIHIDSSGLNFGRHSQAQAQVQEVPEHHQLAQTSPFTDFHIGTRPLIPQQPPHHHEHNFHHGHFHAHALSTTSGIPMVSIQPTVSLPHQFMIPGFATSGDVSRQQQPQQASPADIITTPLSALGATHWTRLSHSSTGSGSAVSEYHQEIGSSTDDPSGNTGSGGPISGTVIPTSMPSNLLTMAPSHTHTLTTNGGGGGGGLVVGATNSGLVVTSSSEVGPVGVSDNNNTTNNAHTNIRMPYDVLQLVDAGDGYVIGTTNSSRFPTYHDNTNNNNNDSPSSLLLKPHPLHAYQQQHQQHPYHPHQVPAPLHDHHFQQPHHPLLYSQSRLDHYPDPDHNNNNQNMEMGLKLELELDTHDGGGWDRSMAPVQQLQQLQVTAAELDLDTSTTQHDDPMPP